jgi:DNA-binding SARP family transcriptional activator
VWGPPGAGKTTAVATYLSHRKLSAVWYQLDASDGDIATFFHHVRDVSPRVLRRRRPLPIFTTEDVAAPLAFARRFFAAFFSGLPRGSVLVLDGYHDVPAKSVFHEAIGESVSQMIEGRRLIAISRMEPPDTFARVRASRQMYLVGWPDLRLTREETTAVLKRLIGRTPTRAAADALYARTDGWVAGVVLMLEQSLTDEAIRQAAEQQSQQVFFDYFAHEIFRSMPAEEQDILLQAAFLPHPTVAMVEALTGASAAGHVLARLARASYFTTRHSRSGAVAYQFHPLLREFLLARATMTYSLDRRRDIQRRAAELLEADGSMHDAAMLMIAGSDFAALASLVCREANTVISQGRTQTLLGWLNSLPVEMVDDDPWLLYWRGAARVFVEPQGAQSDAASATAMFRARGDATGAFLAWAVEVMAYYSALADLHAFDHLVDALDDLRRDFPAYPTHDIEVAVLQALLLALVLRRPEDPQLRDVLARSEAVVSVSRDPRTTQVLALLVAAVYGWLGYIDHARAMVAPFISEDDRARGPTTVLRGMLIVRTALIAGDFDAIHRHGHELLARMRAEGIQSHLAMLIADMAAAALTDGDLKTAEGWLEEMAREVRALNRNDVAYYHYLRAWMGLLRRDLDSARREQTSALAPALAFGMPFAEAIARLLSTHVLHACGEDKEARAHLRRVLDIAQGTGSRLFLYPARLAEAEIAFDGGDDRDGLRALAEAFHTAREAGLTNTYVWRPTVMARLCARALEAGIEVDYVKQLVGKRRLMLDAASADVEAWPWAFRIYTLGRFVIVREGVAMEFRRKVQRRPLALLKALIAFGGRDVSEARLAEALWPDADGDAAGQALATTLHRLRRLLGSDDVIRRQAGTLSLHTGLCWVDLWAVEQRLREAETAILKAAGRTMGHCARLTDRALQLYRGDLLAGQEDAPWAEAMAVRLRRRVIKHLAALGQRLEAMEATPSAIDYYERALALDPGAEELHRRLIAFHIRRGGHAEALSAYARCRQALADVLGTAPSEATEALVRSLRSS